MSTVLLSAAKCQLEPYPRGFANIMMDLNLSMNLKHYAVWLVFFSFPGDRNSGSLPGESPCCSLLRWGQAAIPCQEGPHPARDSDRVPEGGTAAANADDAAATCGSGKWRISSSRPVASSQSRRFEMVEVARFRKFCCADHRGCYGLEVSVGGEKDFLEIYKAIFSWFLILIGSL